MIKANELRIGNYVFSLETQNHQRITGLLEEQPFFDAITFDYPNYDEIEPIPLTEEWLFKFGFELINNNFYRSRNCELCLYWTVNKNKMLPEYYGKRLVTGYDFKYVHQLQNLYFALTGSELTVA